MSPDRVELECDSPDYPDSLRCIPDGPRVLYCMGDTRLLAEEGLAVIGSRRATPYGLSACRLMATYAARSGLTIVSGAAAGCDQEAHRAALTVGGSTVAVLGCGADVDYPRSASELLATMRQVGLVVSEVPWGTTPKRYLFARRNRLIAALSRAVLVVEASLPSGTFGTADRALEYGKDVLVVPGSIFAPESRGSNRLIRQGACPVTDVTELSDSLGLAAPNAAANVEPAHADEVLSALRADPMRPDDVARALGLHVVEVSRRIGRLETEGVIARYPDGRYGPCIGARGAVQSAHAADDTHT